MTNFTEKMIKPPIKMCELACGECGRWALVQKDKPIALIECPCGDELAENGDVVITAGHESDNEPAPEDHGLAHEGDHVAHLILREILREMQKNTRFTGGSFVVAGVALAIAILAIFL